MSSYNKYFFLVKPCIFPILQIYFYHNTFEEHNTSQQYKMTQEEHQESDKKKAQKILQPKLHNWIPQYPSTLGKWFVI